MITRNWKINFAIAVIFLLLGIATFLAGWPITSMSCVACTAIFAADAQHSFELVLLHRTIDAKQAEIDELMLEYCPEEMTVDQLMAWGQHQAVVRRIYENA